jgi:hypothetical protein
MLFEVRLYARGASPADEFDEVIKKEKMREPFTAYVEFAPISEEDEYRRHDDLERLVTSGIVTRSWARKQMSNVDPKAMELEEEKEKLALDPQLQQIKIGYAAGKLAEAISKRTGAENLIGGQFGQPLAQGQQEAGRGLVPPIPDRAPLGSAQNLQNQLAGMRRPSPINQQGQGGGGNRR